MSKYEVINITNFNPNKTSLFKIDGAAREEISYWKCCNKENCEAYKRGRCIMFSSIFKVSRCPYGIREKKVGFTKRANKCGNLEREARKKYPDLFYALKVENNFSKIGDYILFPLPYLSRGLRNPFMDQDDDFWCKCNDKLINQKYYKPDIIKQLCIYKPRALFTDREIIDYQNKLPEFLERLKKYDWKMFQELLKIYPEAENIANKFSYIGKKVLLSTLSVGKVKIKENLCEWDGETIKFLENSILFGVKGTYYLKPDSDVVATICDEKTITGETLLIDD